MELNPDSSNSIHVVPINDVIDHSTISDRCMCGPTEEPVKADDGSIGWLYVHHSLDGREKDEAHMQ